MPKNILITGGAGFIGSNMVRYLLKAQSDLKIINLDALTYAGSLENLKDLNDPLRHTFIHGDICDREHMIRLLVENQVDTVIHFAAESHVDRSILGPGQFIQTNIVGTFSLLEAVRHVWLNEKTLPWDSVRFHHVSTDEVYGTLNQKDPAWTETNPYAPNSPYSASKAASDHLVRAYHQTYGLPVTITNCSNNYGPYQFPEKLIPLIILNALEGKELPIYGDGKQIRDWLYVEDHCEAIWTVIEAGNVGETYNIGGGNQPGNIDVVLTICKILNQLRPNSPHAPYEKLIRYVTDRPGHDRRYAIDDTKIKHALGWRPKEDLQSGLLKTIQWYLDHPEWIDAIRTGSKLNDWMKQNYAARGGYR